MLLQERSGTAGQFLHQITNPACCCCYCLRSHQSPACSRTATDASATQKDALGSWETYIPTLIPAAAIRAWITSVAGCYSNCSATLGAAKASPVCLHGISFYSPVFSWESWQGFLWNVGFRSTAQHCRTCAHARTHTWNSTLGLDPKCCFARSEESHSFQWSLDQTILCQCPKWLHYNYLWIKLLLDTSRNDIISAFHLLGEKNDI